MEWPEQLGNQMLCKILCRYLGWKCVRSQSSYPNRLDFDFHFTKHITKEDDVTVTCSLMTSDVGSFYAYLFISIDADSAKRLNVDQHIFVERLPLARYKNLEDILNEASAKVQDFLLPEDEHF